MVPIQYIIWDFYFQVHMEWYPPRWEDLFKKKKKKKKKKLGKTRVKGTTLLTKY